MACSCWRGALTVLPGAFLAALVVAPRVARDVVAGLFGFLPAILLDLVREPTNGLLTGVSGSLRDLGTAIQGVGVARLQVGGGAVLLIGGAVFSMLLYRAAVARFEQYTPP